MAPPSMMSSDVMDTAVSAQVPSPDGQQQQQISSVPTMPPQEVPNQLPAPTRPTTNSTQTKNNDDDADNEDEEN